MRQTGHKSPIMLARYIRIVQIFTHKAAAASAFSGVLAGLEVRRALRHLQRSDYGGAD
jgi:hypothetical protein